MKVSNFFDVLGGILTIALVATILQKPNTARDIKAAGDAFTGAIREAQS